MAMAAEKAGSSPSRACGTAEGGADEQRGYDLPTPEARAQGQSGEHHFQQEGPGRVDLPFHRQLNDAASRAVVVAAALDEGEDDDKRRPGQHPQVLIRNVFLVQMPGFVHQHAERDGHQRRQHGQAAALQKGYRPQLRRAQQVVCLRRQAQRSGDAIGDKGGQQTGKQSGIVNLPHAHHLQGKHRGGERRAEQSREQPRHTALNDGVGAVVPQPEQTADPGGNAAADL